MTRPTIVATIHIKDRWIEHGYATCPYLLGDGSEGRFGPNTCSMGCYDEPGCGPGNRLATNPVRVRPAGLVHDLRRHGRPTRRRRSWPRRRGHGRVPGWRGRPRTWLTTPTGQAEYLARWKAHREREAAAEARRWAVDDYALRYDDGGRW